MAVKIKGYTINSSGIWNEFFRILLSAFIIVLLQYVYVHTVVLGGQPLSGNTGKSGILYQLYFGGLFFENSMDSFALLCMLGIFIVQTMFLSGITIGEWFQNLEIMFYRTDQRWKLLNRLIYKLAIEQALFIVLDTVIVCAIEHILPIELMLSGGILCLLKGLMFTLFIILLYFWIENEISYIIFGLFYFVPIVFIGFVYDKYQTIGKWGKIFILRGNWSYYSSIKLLTKNGMPLSDFKAFSDVSFGENIAVLTVACICIYIICIQVIKRYEVR